jgi:hypothetical protein
MRAHLAHFAHHHAAESARNGIHHFGFFNFKASGRQALAYFSDAKGVGKVV